MFTIDAGLYLSGVGRAEIHVHVADRLTTSLKTMLLLRVDDMHTTCTFSDGTFLSDNYSV